MGSFFAILVAIVIMTLFIPVAIGLAIRLLAPDWFLQNRKALILGIVIADFILFLGVVWLFFGFA